MKRVGFIVKPDWADTTGEAARLFGILAPRAREHGCEVVVADDDRIAMEGAVIVPRAQLGQGLDLCVVLGGDGTMLGASVLVADEEVPVLGVNLGRLGFLTPFDPETAEQALDDALAGRLTTSERMRLQVDYLPKEGEPTGRAGLNDAVILQGSMARLVELETCLDDEVVSVYRADGLIVSTPTGSTAHNLAAGGPIIAPAQEAMAITPICAHSLTSRPLVVPGDRTVSVTVVGASRGMVLTVDGQWARSLMAGDRVEVRRAEKPLLVYESDKRFFDILREKLHWDARPSATSRSRT